MLHAIISDTKNRFKTNQDRFQLFLVYHEVVRIFKMNTDNFGNIVSALSIFQFIIHENFNTGSYKEFVGGQYWLSKKAMEWFWDAYLPDKNKRSQPYASPLRSSLEQLQGLPETLLIVDENDVLRDEGEAYAHKLMQANVKVTPIRMLGIVHDFLMLSPLKENQISQEALEIVTQKLLKIFKK